MVGIPRFILLCSLFSSLITSAKGQDIEILRNALEDINLLTVNEQVKYNVHSLDPVTNEPKYRMDALHVIELKKQYNINTFGRYAGVYHYKNGGPLDFEIHLATSEDLMNWTFRKVLLTHADMPYILRSESSEIPEEDSWIILAHEEWQTNGNCKLAFKTYYDEDVLLTGSYSFGYTADITLSDKGLEGTPNIYSADLLLRNDRWVIDLEIGFHYNKQVSNEAGARDMVGTATLTDFGNNNSWAAQPAKNYMDHITLQGATGNVGQRDYIIINENKYVLQEGNIQGAPYDKWDFGAWRLWIYQYKDENGVFPAPSNVANINFWDTYFKPFFPRTHNRSTSFGNPSVKILTDPNDINGKVLFAHFFIFGEGAATGEGGPMVFFKKLDSQLFTTSISANHRSSSQIDLNNTQSVGLDINVYTQRKEYLTFKVSSESRKDFRIHIQNINGQVLYSGDYNANRLNQENIIRFYENAGVYIVTVSQHGRKVSKKIVV